MTDERREAAIEAAAKALAGELYSTDEIERLYSPGGSSAIRKGYEIRAKRIIAAYDAALGDRQITTTRVQELIEDLIDNGQGLDAEQLAERIVGRLGAALGGREATERCPNPYCQDGMVLCQGGEAKGSYWIACRVCRGTGVVASSHALASAEPLQESEPESCNCDPNAPGYTNRAGVASCSWCDKPLISSTPSPPLQDGGEREGQPPQAECEICEGLGHVHESPPHESVEHDHPSAMECWACDAAGRLPKSQPSHQCRTPGAIFHVEVSPERVGVTVDLPKERGLSEADARGLENRLHDAIESVLAGHPHQDVEHEERGAPNKSAQELGSPDDGGERVSAGASARKRAAKPALGREMWSTVYVVEGIDTPYVNIGYTTAPVNRRVAGIQHSVPFGVRLLHHEPGGRAREKELHERFAEYRVRGEWFEGRGHLASWLEGLAAIGKTQAEAESECPVLPV